MKYHKELFRRFNGAGKIGNSGEWGKGGLNFFKFDFNYLIKHLIGNGQLRLYTLLFSINKIGYLELYNGYGSRILSCCAFRVIKMAIYFPLPKKNLIFL